MTARRSRARRALAITGLVLGALVVLLLAGFGFLFTNPGERLLKNLAVSALEAGAFEQAEIARLEFHGDRVVLHQLSGRTADGKPAFTADELEADFAIGPALGGRLHLDRLALSGYTLHLQRRADGSWNVSREKKAEGGGLPDFAIDQLALTGGGLELLTGDAALRLEGLGVSGAVAHRDQQWSGALAVNGQATSPTQVALAMSASASTDGKVQRAQVDATAGETRLKARLNTPLGNSEGASWLATLAGELELNIPAFTSFGFEYGPVQVAARIDQGQLEVDRLRLQLPGLLAVSDQTGAGAFSGDVKIDDLSAATQALAALTGRQLPELAGRGQLRVRIDNPITSAGLVLDGQLKSLDAAGLEGRDVKLHGRIADLTRPAQGKLTANAGSVDAGARRLGAVRLELQNQQQHTLLDAEIASPVPASVHLELQLPKQQDGPISLEQLVLTWPGATWRSGAPAQLRLTDAGVELDRLALASSGQRIVLKGAWGRGKKHFDLELAGIRLERLPAALLPKDLDPAGLVEGQLKVSQPRQQLEGSASLNLSQARLAGLSGLSGRLNGKFAGGRLVGSVSGSALEGMVGGRFDLPAELSSRSAAKLWANLTLENASVGGAWPLIEQRLSKPTAARLDNPTGRISGSLELGGTWAEPTLKTRLALKDAAITLQGAPRYTGISLNGEATATRRRITIANLEVRTQQGRLQLSGDADRTDTSQPYRYRLTTAAERFPLPLENPVLATFQAKLDGTASAERITSKVTVSTMRLERVGAPAEPGA